MRQIKALFIVAIMTMTSKVSAFSLTMEDVTKYALPCAVGMLVSSLAVKKDGPAIGAAICGALTTATYLQSNDKKAAEIQNVMSKEHEKMWIQIKANDTRNKKELSVFRDTIRRIVAEKTLELGNRIDERMVKTLESEEFKDKIAKEVVKIAKQKSDQVFKLLDPKTKEQRKKLVREITDEVIKDIVNKKYAEPASSSNGAGGAELENESEPGLNQEN